MRRAGIDEVGRGCLAGPLVACAVVLPEGFSDERIIDSKKLSAKKRNILAKLIKENAVSYGLGVVCSLIIDRINIVRSTKQAMHMALNALGCSFDEVITDAVALKNIEVKHIHPFKAEDKYIEVAAASILAKVYRDSLMERYHYSFQEYNWFSNKGYGTQEHRQAIIKYGVSPIHRRSFIKNVYPETR
ncbi:MAG: ribonuclease HII [Flexistipes sinusarabici]|uniref:Ribonuclease n=1 Tax=Flexistipes sinusarabici TaxID=2352 RepID=A0A5D0MQ98_FLESI|nr:ribonuclease HII [Flexistipes sinusarabici]TYB33800.1 MAG: ribonuclease HII [Flexistipes sinusarabici]